MSSIPYNYGKYIDDKVSMTDQGHVDSGKQIQSPASAGSRGLAKTTQFTNDRTQMQMGNSPIAESMIEIRNILNRIDGVNVPVQENADDTRIEDALIKKFGKDKAKVIMDYAYSQMTDSSEEIMKSHGLTFKGDTEDDKRWFQKYPWLAQLDNKPWMGRLFDIAGQGPDYGTPVKMDDAVQEKRDNTDIDIRKLLVDISSMKDRIAELAINDDAKTSALTALGQVEDDVAQEIKGSFPEEESYKPFPEEDEMTFEDDDAFYEAFGELGFPEDENELFDAEYRGRKVPLNKPMRGDVKKFKVYVKDPKSGNVKKVNFGHGGSSARKAGQKTMKIRKSNPKARKSFRARHNCANPGPKTKARYWSCRKW